MTNDKTVTMPRELIEEVVAQLDDFITGDVLERLKSALAAPVGERKEPVAWIKPDVAATLRGDECCYAFGAQNPKGSLIPLYAAPVTWKLPDPHGRQSNLKDTQYAMGWNACLDKVKELNYQGHASDCSTNNRGVPELLGPCDCELSQKTP